MISVWYDCYRNKTYQFDNQGGKLSFALKHHIVYLLLSYQKSPVNLTEKLLLVNGNKKALLFQWCFNGYWMRKVFKIDYSITVKL